MTASELKLSEFDTVKILSGSAVFTFHLSCPTALSRNGLDAATQPEHLMFVLNFSVSIYEFLFYEVPETWYRGCYTFPVRSYIIIRRQLLLGD